MDHGSGANNYLHKKFKKQTSIEPSIVIAAVAEAAAGPASHVPTQPVQESRQQHQQPFWHHSTNSDEPSTLKSSISSAEGGTRPAGAAGTAYTFVNFGRQTDRQEPPVATALVVRKFDTTTTNSSEQSDEDISANTKLKRSSPINFANEVTEHFIRSSSIAVAAEIAAKRRSFGDDAPGAPGDVGAAPKRAYEAATSAISMAASNGGKYVCPYCSLACSKPSVLQKHIRAHTNERPYPCQSCNFSFKTRSNLYKHCRSRTHVNRVMGGGGGGKPHDADAPPSSTTPPPQLGLTDRPSVITDTSPATLDTVMKAKPYKPRFHTKSYYDNENDENCLAFSNEKNPEDDLQVQPGDRELAACKSRLPPLDSHHSSYLTPAHNTLDAIRQNNINNNNNEEPLNLTNKNRKRCMSEVFSEPTKKSLIKELLLKNLYADSNMQCPHCKMIFRTFTELELHKMKLCKGRGASRYSRSSSVNVASIFTQNADSMPQNAMMHLKSPGPFLGKTRLVEADKNKSFSCDDTIRGGGIREIGKESPHYQSSFDFLYERVRKPTVKLFGGEVKVTNHTDLETYPMNGVVEKPDYHPNGKRLSENRVIRNSLQSGGIVMHATEKQNAASVIKTHEKPESRIINGSSTTLSGDDYGNIMDFSQNAAKLLAPNLKQLNLTIPGIPPAGKFIEASQASLLTISQPTHKPEKVMNGDLKNPLSLLVNGKVVRHVPGMPGPVATEPIKPKIQITPVCDDDPRVTSSPSATSASVVKVEVPSPPHASSTSVKVETLEPPSTEAPPARKFARPNSLALKPSSASLKHHHGLTPTMFNQILISPDTPRGDKKYNEQFLHGNYFSYLGLKSSTRPVYCTLNKTQPFYVPHFKKLSMYSEWRQQDNKSDKLYVSNYDSRQRNGRMTIAGKYDADYLVHSSYKDGAHGEATSKKDETACANGKTTILGGYESHEEYTYIRGRGRGRFVCDQCGIRCKKPSMLKKHIRTHSNDRPYTCNECKYSFKTKGNLTKHLKSKSHTKIHGFGAQNTCSESDSLHSTRGSGSPASFDSNPDDSDVDSGDESSTRNQEQEAAYGLLSLSQKVNPAAKEPLQSPSTSARSPSSSCSTSPDPKCSFINAEQLAHVSKTNYAKNKILDHSVSLTTIKLAGDAACANQDALTSCQGAGGRPLTYPYTTQNTANEESLHSSSSTSMSVASEASRDQSPEQNITHFNVIKRYNPQPVAKPHREIYRQQSSPSTPINHHQNHQQSRLPVLIDERKRKLSTSAEGGNYNKMLISSETMVNEKIHNGPAIDEHRREVVQMKNAKNRATSAMEDYPIEHFSAQTNKTTHNGLLKVREVRDYDNSAMETLAEIATKQEKLEKNAVAKNVATELLKLATMNENLKTEEKSFAVTINVVPNNELIANSEEDKNCSVCHKTFNKPSQLRLHMNIHYLERPFKCESCSVSFRTKGHLQKHERSASHHNKLSTSPAFSSMEPRPFKCTDCSIAFRIHGHLAKHLRSKMHILKLECLSKIPFGLYAELERSNSLLTEINTADGVQCLDSLKALAQRIFVNDPSKLNQMEDRAIQKVDAGSS